jgi:glycosyltransferase involved in cell wall biosynthesis
MIKVSVVIPAYNVSAYIEDAIDSVLAQSFTDFEVVVVDDGSTDDTASIVKRYDDWRVRLVSQQNRGLAGARNTGIRVAEGEYVAFLDADDLWHPEKLKEHVLHLDQNPEIGVSYSVSQFMDESGKPLSLYQTPKLSDVEVEDVLLRNPVGNGSAPVIRMATLQAIETIDSRYGCPEPIYFDPDFKQSEDIECWVRIASTTEWRFAGIGRALTLYRLNSGGLSASVARQLASWEAFFDKACRYAPALMAESGSLARAYQCRYLARRAVWSREPRLALQLLRNAFAADWRILFLEPARTLATSIAVTLQAALPAAAYQLIERTALATRTFVRS